MSDKHRPETRLVGAGRRSEWLDSMVNVPIHRTSTILFDSVAEMRAAYPPEDGRLTYGRHGTRTQWALSEALTELEPGAAGTRLFPSGLAAVGFALLSVLEPGDEMLMVDSAYQPTRSLCDRALKRLGIATRYYDPLADAGALEALIGDRTKAIFMESPGSLSFEVQDVPGICAMGRARGLMTLLDNSWATPLMFRAIEAGVDLSILACTKYVGGHSDLMLGSVTASERAWGSLVRTSRSLGQYVSPDDAFLASRGLRTLGVRLRRHEQSALQIARWLDDRADVAMVMHPALKGSPGHDLWRRDFQGSTGLFSFVLKDCDDAQRDALIDRLELFGIGYSWGGFESIAVPAEPVRTAAPLQWPGPAIRLHVGLEDPDDLIADLEQALAGSH